MEEKKGTKLGQWLAGVIFTTGIACVAAIVIAITCRIVSWILF